MAESVRERAIAALMSRLNASPPAGVPPTTDGFMVSVQPSALPSITLFPAYDEEDEIASGFQTSPLNVHSMEVVIEVRAKGDGTASPRAIADPICNWIDERVNGYVLPQVILKSKITRTEWETELEDNSYVKVTISLTVKFQSLLGDATKWS